MIVAVASGKGGTGKTLVSTNLFNVLDQDTIYVDCDVEEPNGHLFLKPVVKESETVSIPVPLVDETKCNHCGRCAEVCQFNALIVAKPRVPQRLSDSQGAMADRSEHRQGKVLVFPELCHGCGSCSYFCPEKAITESPRPIGKIETGLSDNKKVLTGKLNIGEPMAPPVIRQIKDKISNERHLVIIDSPPGTSCPVIESIKNTDFVVLVTEPTPFGLHDLKLAVEVVRKLKISFGIVVNKSGLGGNLIRDYCKEENIKILQEIDHDNEIAEIYSKGELITCKEKYRNIFQQLYQEILKEAAK